SIRCWRRIISRIRRRRRSVTRRSRTGKPEPKGVEFVNVDPLHRQGIDVHIRSSLAGLGAAAGLAVVVSADAQTPGAPATTAAPSAATAATNPRGTPTTLVVKFRVKAGKNA